MPDSGRSLTALDLCTGAGGEAVGIEAAGFDCAATVEIDAAACATLRENRPRWRVLEMDLHDVDGADYRGVDLVAAGVPCPPFSIAGKQLGHEDERDLFPQALRVINGAKPAAVLLENVRGFAAAKFADYRAHLIAQLDQMGYGADYRVLNASDYGVPQLRPRFVLVAIRHKFFERFRWPDAQGEPPTVGDTIGDLMASGGWPGAERWREGAQGIAPTLVGGSKKHGGPDLGPTRARREWKTLGVDGLGLWDEPPGPLFPVDGLPRLTVPMAALVQGFPPDWRFAGRKTAAYRQVGNAFPPPVSQAVAEAIAAALNGNGSRPVTTMGAKMSTAGGR